MTSVDWSCPFTWDLKKVLPIRTASTSRNLDEYKFTGIPLMTFMISIIRSFESMEKDGDECTARQFFKEAEITLSKLYEDTDIMDISKALEHIYQATAAFIDQKNDPTKEVEDISQRVPDIRQFNEIQLAGLKGCKSFALSLYHLHFIDDAITLGESAIRGNPKNALWYYVFGRCLRKKRRNVEGCDTTPQPLEISSFSKAAQLCPHAFYQIYFIQAVEEANFKNTDSSSKQLEFSRIQWNMYKEMWRTCDDQPVILLKVVLGMLRCSRICDFSIVHFVLDRVDELSKENVVSYFYRGRAYKLQGQYEKALEYLKRSADKHNFVADLECLNCMFKTRKPAVDIIIHLVRMRLKYKHEHPGDQQQILLNLAIMYYRITDYKTSAKLFLRAIQMSPDSPKLKKPYFFAHIRIPNAYSFLRWEILPTIDMDMDTEKDSELADTSQQLMYHCTMALQTPTRRATTSKAKI